VASPLTSQVSAFGNDTTADAAVASHDALLSAILLGGLFIGSGLLAFYAGFSENHPRMKTYLSMRKQLPKQQESATRFAFEAERARRSLEHARGEAHRARLRADDAMALADATIEELKELVRVEISGHMGMPEATSGLVTSRPRGGEETESAPVAVPKPRPAVSQEGGPLNWVVPPATLWGGEQSADGHGALNGHGPADSR